MALWECNACHTAYSVGAPACPQCSADDYVEQGAAPIPSAGEPIDPAEDTIQVVEEAKAVSADVVVAATGRAEAV